MLERVVNVMLTEVPAAETSLTNDNRYDGRRPTILTRISVRHRYELSDTDRSSMGRIIRYLIVKRNELSSRSHNDKEIINKLKDSNR